MSKATSPKKAQAPHANGVDGENTGGEGNELSGKSIEEALEHSEQSAASKKETAERQRRKPSTIEELRKIARLMSFEDRAAAIHAIKADLFNDVEEEEKAAAELLEKHKSKVGGLSNLKASL